MSLSSNRFLQIEVGTPAPAVLEPEARLDITVVFTSVDATAAALRRAAALASSLRGRITLVVVQIVPFPLPLTSPPVQLDFQEQRCRDIAATVPVDTTVQLYLCRDGVETLKRVLKPHSLIVIGGQKRFWPTPAKRLAASLRKYGHEVVLAETE